MGGIILKKAPLGDGVSGRHSKPAQDKASGIFKTPQLQRDEVMNPDAMPDMLRLIKLI